jgi:hypothetical protein
MFCRVPSGSCVRVDFVFAVETGVPMPSSSPPAID